VDKLPAARLRKSGSKVIREQQRAELLKSRLLAVHGKWQRQGDVRTSSQSGSKTKLHF